MGLRRALLEAPDDLSAGRIDRHARRAVSRSAGGCRRGLTVVSTLLATTCLTWLVSVLSLHLSASDAPRQVHRLIIPAGTATLVAAGANALSLPPTMGFVAGDVLELVNRDDVSHAIGTWRVGPHDVRIVRFPRATGDSFFCSIHPSGTLDIEVRARGVDLSSTIPPALALGPGLAVVVLVVRRVVRSLAA